MTLVTWTDHATCMVWYAVEEAPDVKIGIPEEALVAERDVGHVVMRALAVLRDELRGQSGECVLTAGEVRTLALLPENP